MRALCAGALSYSLRCLSPVLGRGFGRSFSIFLMQGFHRTLLLQFSLLAQEFAALDLIFEENHMHNLLEHLCLFGSNMGSRISCGLNSV